MLLSLPTELLVAVMKDLGIADLFRMRRVHSQLKREADALLSTTQTVSLCVFCSKSERAVVSSTACPSLCLMLPESSSVMGLMPAVQRLCVWPRFSSDQKRGDNKIERKLFATHLKQLLRRWSRTLLTAEVICDKDHRMDLKMPQMPHLIRFAMTNITTETMQSLLNSAPGIQEIVYLQSDFQCERLTTGWKVMEKVPDENGTPGMQFLDQLCQHQKQFESLHTVRTAAD